MNNILAIGDSHIPFEHRNYLEFCLQTKKKYKCNIVIHMGDLVDNHSISYHEHDPNGLSAVEEIKRADKRLTKWFKAFPKLKLCRGNHDVLVDRKGKTVGLPERCFKQFRDIWSLPSTWEDSFEFVVDNVLFKHGTGMSGRYAHVASAERSRMSTVIGHTHSSSGVEYMASSKDCIFGMNVGCGIDRKAYAFNYGKDFPRKPILSCGVILDGGKHPLVIPMEL